MRTFTFAACTSTLISYTAAFALKERDVSAPKLLSAPIQRRHVVNPLQRDRLRRRAKVVEVTLTNEETLYYANATIGTPAQSFRLHLDTGSSDLWVNTPTSEICTYENKGLCDDDGTYTANDSSTYEYVNSLFTITYADGSTATGDYVTDDFTIGGTTLTAQQFAIGYNSTSSEGILGVGYASNEAILAYQGATSYANVPQSMFDQGFTNTNAYSLWLNDLDASTGEILFGGVNTEKFTGNLSLLPIVKYNGIYQAFYLALTGVGLDGTAGSINSSLDVAVLLDSGSSLTYLPDAITADIYSKYGLTYNSEEGAAYIDCSRATDNSSILFTFSEPTITVDFSELVVVIGSRGNTDICIFGIAPTEGSTPVLGDTFLRSAYVVYDLTDNKIALAQTNFNATTDNILEITAATGTDSGIPDATGVASAVTSVSGSSGDSSTDAINGLGTVSSEAAAAATPAPRGQYPGMGVAAAVAGVAMFAL